MLRTYKAMLRGDHVEWIDAPPAPNGPVPVHITVLETEHRAERAREMVAALEALAAAGGVASIPDPSAWQQDVRRDNPLPGRED